MTATAQSADTSRLDRLIGFLHQDPDNAVLLQDAAEAALACGRADTAAAILEAAAHRARLSDRLSNLQGLSEMQLGRYDAAAERFEGLLQSNPAEPGLMFNLAWCRAMTGDYAAAAALIDDRVIDRSDRAASLLIEALHHQGRVDEALARGKDLAVRRPFDQRLMGALANLALDAEEPALAQAFAGQAGDNPDGLAVLGMLDIEQGAVSQAEGLFRKALAASPDHPRALLGLGLTTLNGGDQAEGAEYLDQAAAGLGDHLGTWVAAAWAHFAAGDLKASRARFETALALDDTFAETQGGLAVLDIIEGDLASGKKRADVALRLDRHCFAGALAKSLLLSSAGDQAGAERIRQLAFNSPISEGGPTLAEAMSRIAAGRR